MNRRVVITGVGLVTPLGIGTNETWTALCSGKSGIAPITRFDTTDFQTKIAGEVKGFNAEDHVFKKDSKRFQLFISYAIAAARMALHDSGLIIEGTFGDQVGVLTGCGLGGLQILESTALAIEQKGPKRITPFFIPMMIGNMAAGMISLYFGAKGPNASIATACAAGTHAVGEAYQIIKYGHAQAMITGGVEAVITPTCIAGFNAMKALSVNNHHPEKASRPFDKNRDGFVVGEGSGILVLETLESAIKRNAKIYAEVVGYGMSSDAYHMTSPPPDGNGAVRCMEKAIADAQITYNQIDYINAHGTSTPLNDLYETIAIKTVLKDKAHKVAISSTKSMTGHLLGGAGGIETVFTALSVHTGIIPPTINLENPDEECDLDYTPSKARQINIQYAMNNSFGFGGTNAVIVLKKAANL